MMNHIYLVLIAVTTLWTVAGILAVLRIRRRKPVQLSNVMVPVTVLKPLCGVDNELEENLRSFFDQDYANMQLVFGVQGQDDPSIAIVNRLRRAYPNVASRLVIHQGGRGINPKVSNLRAMMVAAEHDVVVISDSNIRVGKDYLREMSARLQHPEVGLVTNLFTGVGEETLGARLENLHLNGGVAAGNALPTEYLNMPVVVGKSMMFRRSTFERLGGFASVKNLLAEDYVIGRMFDEAGYSIEICAQPVYNICQTTTMQTFVKRHLRWGMIRLRLKPAGFILEPLTIPLFTALLAPLFGASIGWSIMWALSLTLTRDIIQWSVLRGTGGLLKALPLIVLRDVLVFTAWLATPFFRHVTWRGTKVRVSAGTRLYAQSDLEVGRVSQVPVIIG